MEDGITLPMWLQVAGRLHPVLLHLPIGLLIFSVVFLFFRLQFKKKQFQKVMQLFIVLTSLSATFTALFGFFLSIGGDYGDEVLQQHKITGIVLSIVCYIWLLIFQSVAEKRIALYAGSVLLIGLLVATGHSGSVLTHGENFVWAPMQRKQEEVKSINTSSLYEIAVQPIFEKKCYSCHNESKAKGRLIMTSVAKFTEGGENGKEWVAGQPDSSRMMKFIHLPLEHDDHMPPDGKPQLSAFEISMLEAWISAGADFEKKFSEYKSTDTLVVLANKTLLPLTNNVQEYSFEAAPEELIKKLNTPFRTVFPLYQNSPALQVDFFVKDFFSLTALEELTEVKEQVVVLNLSKMPIADVDLKLIAQFKSLETLNLNFTSVKGEGLQYLKELTHLKLLSLSGTEITKEFLEPLLALPELKSVFIWNTRLTADEKTVLEKSHPAIQFTQSIFTDNNVLALSKPMILNEGLLKSGEMLQLKHTMPGVTIRFTVDGSQPDSSKGFEYTQPLPLTETTQVKAIACKQNWFCSSAMENTVYVEGLKPLKVELLKPADKQYPGEGATSLTDLRKGIIDVLREPSWLGFRDNNFEAIFHFGNNPPAARKAVLSYADNLGGYIFPPVEVEVWGGNNTSDLKLLSSIKPEQPQAYRSQKIDAITVSFKPANYQMIKLVAKPISKLPTWHGGKGQKGWFFVDEVFFY